MDHYVEAEKHNPKEVTNVLLRNYFIMCLVGRFTGKLTSLDKNDAITTQFDGEFCGEYGK